MRCIDIHSHLIHDVDDGSKTLEQSMKNLLLIKKIGLKEIVCTPHAKAGRNQKKIETNFLEIQKYAKALDIKLYLGNEILWSDKTLELLKEKKLLTMNNSNYILLEFKRNEHMHISNIINIIDEFNEAGYKVVFAHPEKYINYRKIEYIRRIKETGAMLQIDSTSLYGNIVERKFTKKLLKEKLVDVVSSDSHCSKKRSFKILKKAYKKIKRENGFDYTDIIFYKNPLNIIGGNYEEDK